ncbi:MAG: preprotein translocase subunit SecE [Patescibacteria group bacterium]
METTGRKTNPFSWFIQYVRESKGELMKVTWPSKQDITKYSLTVIVVSLAIAIFFAGFDFLVNAGLEWLIKLTH